MTRSTTAHLVGSTAALALMLALVLAPAPALAQFFVPAPQVWIQAVLPVPPGESAEPYDAFGHALASGDFDGDGFDDLAVGAPGQSRITAKRTYSGSGAVNLFYGVAAGVSTTSVAYLDQAAAGVGGLESSDCFGAAVALGDTTGDGYAELYVGVPHENDAGAYQRFLTGLSGVAYLGSVLVLQPGQGESEPLDRFGREMVLGDFDGNGLPDLAVSAPGESFGTISGAGQVHVKYHDYPQVILP